MARNTLMDLYNTMFEQLERLNDEELTPEQLDMEAKRAKAMSGIASNMIGISKIMLDAAKATQDQGIILTDTTEKILIPQSTGGRK